MKSLMACIIATLSFAPTFLTAAPLLSNWLLSRAPSGATLSDIHLWNISDTRLIVADPIVFPNGLDSRWVGVPDGPAQVQLLGDGSAYNSPYAAVVILHDAMPTCQRSAGIFGVDAGMGAFLTERAQHSIAKYLKTLPEGWTLYDGLIYDQNGGDTEQLTIFKLPDMATFAGFATGGDGGFSVQELFDAKDTMVALLVDISRETPSPFSLPEC